MKSGIYQITNQVNGKRYIGSAVNIQRRWNNHLCRLCRGQHENQYLQRAFEKYGEDAFVFSIVEHVEIEKLIEREQDYLDTFQPEYNISPTAGSPLGIRRSLETRIKMSGKPLSVEHRRKISEAQRGERNHMYGKHHTVETRAKLSAAFKGRLISAETRTKMSAAQMGHPVSAETRAKISVAQKAHWRRVRAMNEK